MPLNKRMFRLFWFLMTGFVSSVAFSASQYSENHIVIDYPARPSEPVKPSPKFLHIPDFLKPGHVLFHLGYYWGNQGKEQHINIETLVGDQFTVSQDRSTGAVVGLGYLLDGPKWDAVTMSYGINVFYLSKASVSGTVVQENLYENLSYRYNITHFPVYFNIKSRLDTQAQKYAYTLDVGIGPNFIKTYGFTEHSLDGGITIPDSIFSGSTSTKLSATAGVGFRINQLLGKAPLECGYRFFYLGRGQLNIINSQVLNSLNTSSTYANALTCSLII